MCLTGWTQVFVVVSKVFDVIVRDDSRGQLSFQPLVLLLQVPDQRVRRVLIHRRLRLDLLGSVG